MAAATVAGRSHAETTTTPPTTDGAVNRDMSVWGHFGLGTWKQVRIETESLNGHGEVVDKTTTDSKTTLVQTDSRSLSLKIEASVNVAGKRFQSQPEIVECGYFGEAPNEPSDQKVIGTTQLSIDGRDMPCHIRQVVANFGQLKQITRMYVSDDTAPFLLKRETTVLAEDGRTDRQNTTVEVIGLEMPYQVLNDMKSTAWQRTIQRTARGTNVTIDITCGDVPGGIVARTSKEFDENNRLVRRSNLQLVDYHAGAQQDDDDDVSSVGGKMVTRREARRARHAR